MDCKHIQEKMDELSKRKIPEETRRQIEEDFEADYTYDTLALSGSSLTREEVRAILAALKKQNGGK